MQAFSSLLAIYFAKPMFISKGLNLYMERYVQHSAVYIDVKITIINDDFSHVSEIKKYQEKYQRQR